LNCDEVREALPTYMRDGESLLAVRRHLGECRECRIRLERYDQLIGSLGRLETAVFEPPPELYSSLVAIPRTNAGVAEAMRGRAVVLRGHVTRNRRAYIGGMGLAVAGAAGAALWRTRTRRLAAA
jgi:predicted anti-sigma-YlaC factor YlaD